MEKTQELEAQAREVLAKEALYLDRDLSGYPVFDDADTVMAGEAIRAMIAFGTRPREEATRAGEDLEASARAALMYLETGFVECERCGNEVETKDLDAAYELRDALSTPAVHPAPGVREGLAKLAYETWYRSAKWEMERTQRDLWYKLADAILAAFPALSDQQRRG